MSGGVLPRVVVLTGASGVLGRALWARFAGAGCEVRALTRREVAGAPAGRQYRLELPGLVPGEAFEGAGAVIHAAYAMRAQDQARAHAINVEGTRGVREAARRAGVARFVFVSSVSAHEGALGEYGKSKLMLEREMDPARDLVVRPGLILAPGAGLFDRMMRVAGSTGLAPMFGGGGQEVQTIHVDDLAACFDAALRRDLVGSLTLCEERGLTMRELFVLVGRLAGRRVRPVPVPFAPALLALRAGERMGLRLPVTADNLLGLRSMVHAESGPSLARVGVAVRDAERSLRDLMGLGPTAGARAGGWS